MNIQMHKRWNAVISSLLLVIMAIIATSLITKYRRNNRIHESESNLLKIGQAFEKYVEKHKKLPSSGYFGNNSWSKVLVDEGFVNDPRIFLSPELLLINNTSEYEDNDLSFVYNRGDEIGGYDENKDGLYFDEISVPQNTILLVECFGAGRWEQVPDYQNQLTSVKDARQIADITKKMAEYKADLGYLVLFADGHLERFKSWVLSSDQRLKYIKNNVNHINEASLCKEVVEGKPIELTVTYKKGDIIGIFVKWSQRNYNKVSFEIYSRNYLLMAELNMINRGGLSCWANFLTEDDKWRKGEYVVKIYVNGSLLAERIFNLDE